MYYMLIIHQNHSEYKCTFRSISLNTIITPFFTRGWNVIPIHMEIVTVHSSCKPETQCCYKMTVMAVLYGNCEILFYCYFLKVFHSLRRHIIFDAHAVNVDVSVSGRFANESFRYWSVRQRLAVSSLYQLQKSWTRSCNSKRWTGYPIGVKTVIIRTETKSAVN